MRVAGIISEYNPLHEGHISQLNKVRDAGADRIIVVMSGDFVQRGEPAIFDKAARTKAALLAGADLVLEIPVMFATASAPDFAKASVTLLDKLGIVTDLCFGSECGDIDRLKEAAKVLNDEPLEFKEELKNHLRNGDSYPKASAKAYSALLGNETAGINDARNEDDLFSAPNNILGIEYIRALMMRKSHIAPVTFKREGQAYHDTSPDHLTSQKDDIEGQNRKGFPSAAAIREAVKEDDFDYFDYLGSVLSADERGAFTDTVPIFADDLSGILNERLLKISSGLTKEDTAKNLGACFTFTPELANRLSSHIFDFDTFSKRVEQLKSRTYTYSRVSRALLHLVLGIKGEDAERAKQADYISYIRVLGFRRSAEDLLGLIEENCPLPLITKTAGASECLNADGKLCFSLDLFASHLYQSLVFEKSGKHLQNEYTRPLIII